VRERERERIIIREGGSDQFFWPLKRGDAQNGGLAEGYGGGGIFTVLVAVLQSAKKSTHSNICSSFSGMSVYNMRVLLSPLLLLLSQSNPNQPISNREEEEEVARSWN
jgi:hypothetical protein